MKIMILKQCDKKKTAPDMGNLTLGWLPASNYFLLFPHGDSTATRNVKGQHLQEKIVPE